MESVALVATAAYPYAGRPLVTGEVFEASPRDAHILKVVGRAIAAPDVSPEQPMVRMRALIDFERMAAGRRHARGEVFLAHDVEALALERYGKAELVGEEPAPLVEAPRKKRQYRRRDLRAEP